MRFTHFVMAAVAVGFAAQSAATNIPTEPIGPIGCATTYIVPGDSVPPADTLNVEITASRQWGVVPFEVQLDVIIIETEDSIAGVAWDFDADGLADAWGTPVSQVFTEAVDHPVTAEVTTFGHGVVTASATISGHSALMTLTFDDAHNSVIGVALPLLQARGVTGTVYVVPTWVGWSWYMSWPQLHALEDLGWDIESHGLTHVDLTKVDSLTLHNELAQSKAELQAQGFDADHFAPPFGACNGTVINATKQYYQSCRNWRGLNLPIEEVDPYQIRWEVTSSGKYFAGYKNWMDSVMTYGGWFVLNSHVVSPSCSGITTCVTEQMLADIVDYALENRMKIVNMEEALSSVEAEARRWSPQQPPPAAAGEEYRLNLSGVPVSSFPLAVTFAVPRGASADVSIYDACGRLVRRLARGSGGQDQYQAAWNGENSSGAPVADGCYFCVLRAESGALLTSKIIVAR